MSLTLEISWCSAQDIDSGLWYWSVKETTEVELLSIDNDQKVRDSMGGDIANHRHFEKIPDHQIIINIFRSFNGAIPWMVWRLHGISIGFMLV